MMANFTSVMEADNSGHNDGEKGLFGITTSVNTTLTPSVTATKTAGEIHRGHHQAFENDLMCVFHLRSA